MDGAVVYFQFSPLLNSWSLIADVILRYRVRGDDSIQGALLSNRIRAPLSPTRTHQYGFIFETEWALISLPSFSDLI